LIIGDNCAKIGKMTMLEFKERYPSLQKVVFNSTLNDPRPCLTGARMIAIKNGLPTTQIETSASSLNEDLNFFTSVEDAVNALELGSPYIAVKAGRYLFMNNDEERAMMAFGQARNMLLRHSAYPGDQSWQEAFSLALTTGLDEERESMYKQLLKNPGDDMEHIRTASFVRGLMTPSIKAKEMLSEGNDKLSLARYLAHNYYYRSALSLYQKSMGMIYNLPPKEAVQHLLETIHCIRGVGSFIPFSSSLRAAA